jgi:hypothetical protein
MFLIAFLIAIWPSVEQATRPNAEAAAAQEVLGITIPPAVALLLLVIVASSLGGFVHAATSFADYVGNRRLAVSWVWWYVLRSVIGMSLALVVYFAVRGGLFSGSAGDQQVNPFGLAGISGVVGLFSKQATDKLRELFDTFFRTAVGAGDDSRQDSISNPAPAIAGIEPPVMEAGMDTVTVRGTGFTPDSQVRVNRTDTGAVLQSTSSFVGPTELSVAMPQEDVASACTLQMTVFNPEPGGGTSDPVRVEIRPPA